MSVHLRDMVNLHTAHPNMATEFVMNPAVVSTVRDIMESSVSSADREERSRMFVAES